MEAPCIRRTFAAKADCAAHNEKEVGNDEDFSF